jgi:hypothetical protein
MGIDVYEVFTGPTGVAITIAEALTRIRALPVSATMQRRVLRAWADASGRVPTPEDFRSLTGPPAAPAGRDRYA